MGLYYKIFSTSWGYFGLVADGGALVSSFLPVECERGLEDVIKCGFPQATRCSNRFAHLEGMIAAYFDGERIEFGEEIAIQLRGTEFTKGIMTACRGLGYGQTANYGQLAQMAGRRGACRAAGTVMSGNSLPLIVPCHRIIKSDGSFGGFSAGGGVTMKRRLLNLERKHAHLSI